MREGVELLIADNRAFRFPVKRGDKMTREEAIDVIKHNYPSACFTDLCEAVEIALQALSAQPERTGKWIPQRERLPEDGEWCLFTDGVSMSVERYKEDALDHFFPEGRWFRLEDAIAWMSLPEPYQEESEE